VPTEARESDEIGLLDLVACTSDHKPGTQIAATRKDNRLRQIKTALDKLAEPGLGLVFLPNAGKPRDKYDNAEPRNENGDRTTGLAVDYQIPRPGPATFSIPAEFFLNGWVHALTDSEIAAWLMFRDLSDLNVAEHERPGVHISGDDRVGTYCLSRDVWDSHVMLERMGLLSVEAAEGRRANGTFEDFRHGEQPIRHRFWIADETLSQPAVPAVLAAVTEHVDELGATRGSV
jgi:hypothetical protein